MPRHNNKNLILRDNEKIIMGDNPANRVELYNDGNGLQLSNFEHTHISSDITDLGNYAEMADLTTLSGILQSQIDGKSEIGHTHTESDISDFGDYATNTNLLTTSGTLQSAIDNIDTLPDQTGNSGKYLTTDGSTASWATVSGGGTSDHSVLDNLDYASAGHTGFQPAGNYITDAEITTISGNIVAQIPSDYYTTSEVDALTWTENDITDLDKYTQVEVDTLVSTTSGVLQLAIDTHNHDGTYEPANADIQLHLSNTNNPHSVDETDILPSQAGQTGKFLTTDGVDTSWATISGSGGDGPNFTGETLNNFSELTDLAGEDLIAVYDTSYSGTENLKKYSIENFKSDLTSMDPGAFGNWILEREYNLNNEAINDTIDWDGEINSSIRLVTNLQTGSDDIVYLRINEDATNYDYGSIYQDGAALTGGYNSAVGIWLGGNQQSVFNILEGNLSNTGYSRPFYLKTVKDYSANSNALLASYGYRWLNSVNDVTSITITSLSSTATGTIKIYKWQEIKPIELHSYELVKEYNLSNEILDDTFDWDGEAYPDCKIICSMTAGRADIVFNGDDTTTAYAQRFIYATGAGTSTTAGTGTTYDKMNIGASDRYTLTDVSLRQNNVRSIINHNGIVDGAWNLSWWKWVDSRAITSLEINSNSAVATGNIRIYRLAKTHLFNQTIYNDVTLNVTTTGSDITGDGTSQNPFASINGAVAWLKNKTINNDASVTIKLADGTYSPEYTSIATGPTKLSIVGNTVTPSNVTLNFASGSHGIAVSMGVNLILQGMKLHGYSNAEGKRGLNCQYNATVYMDNMLIDNFGYNIYSTHCGYIYMGTGCTLDSGNKGASAAWLGNIGLYTATVSNNTTGLLATNMGRIIADTCNLTGNTSNSSTNTGGLVTIA